MANRLAPIALSFLAVFTIATTLPAQAPDTAAAAPGAQASGVAEPGISKVRIVRISETKGVVHVDGNIGRGFEPAMANLPIVENSRIRTDTGAVEVEFEDNSTMRLAPDSLAVFTRLDRLASGETESTVTLLRGMAYFSLIKAKANQFTVSVGPRSISLAPGTHVRLGIKEDEATLAVLDGSVHVDGPQAIDIGKKHTAVFSVTNGEQPVVAEKVSPEAFDQWDKDSVGYHARAASFGNSFSSPYSYGLADMAYYGAFNSYGSCGSMWRPYFASAAWDPYSNGAWAWYGNSGYSWVSPYPWGWMPYHYGSWSYCPTGGWGWQPGGYWNGLNNMTAVSPVTGGGPGSPVGKRPVHPTFPPRPGQATIMAVNLKPLVRSGLSSSESFSFVKDSAGLGVPRDTLGKLQSVSRQTLAHGNVSTPVYMSAESAGRSVGEHGQGAAAPIAIHRGYSTPSPVYSASEPGGGRSMVGSTSSSSISSSSRSTSMGGNSGGGSPGGGAPSSGGSHK